jgi:hypothetical protein
MKDRNTVIRKIKNRYGEVCFSRWGKKGGSPLLSPEKVREYNRSKGKRK